MSTHSAIVEKTENGYRGIYCHWDGHIETNGKTLQEHYQNPGKVKQLIDLGAISFLGERVDPVEEHSFSKPEKGPTIAYHRDRGDDKLGPYAGVRLTTVTNKIDYEFVYVFEDGKWTVNGDSLEEKLKHIS